MNILTLTVTHVGRSRSRVVHLFLFIHCQHHSHYLPTMHPQPKTPSRHRTRSEAKTPLTPSIVSGLNGVNLNSSPSKRRTKAKSVTAPYDMSNPFISAAGSSRSRPASPVKFPSAADLQRQAASGVIRKGGIESKFDVVKMDYVPPPKTELKRSKSTPVSFL